MRRIKGYCNVQNKEQVVFVDEINVSTHEDANRTALLGRVNCEYNRIYNASRCNKCSMVEGIARLGSEPIKKL